MNKIIRTINTFAEYPSLTKTHKQRLALVINSDAQAAYNYCIEQYQRDWEDTNFKRGFKRIADFIEKEFPIWKHNI